MGENEKLVDLYADRLSDVPSDHEENTLIRSKVMPVSMKKCSLRLRKTPSTRGVGIRVGVVLRDLSGYQCARIY